MATNDKYDRQLRLWGANGQRALMTAHILLINADAVGTETLKNLVLPGIGRFTVLDDKLVTSADLGNNFFVTPNDVGRPRAEVVSELLCEMNPDVVGFALTSYPNSGSVSTEFWSQFSLIIAANMAEASMLELASICTDNNLPLMLVRSYGLLNDSFVSMEDAQDSVSIHSIALSQRTFPDNTGIPSSHVSITHMPPSLLHAYHLPGGPGGGSSGSAPLWKGKKNDALRALDQGALDTIHVTKLGELGW